MKKNSMKKGFLAVLPALLVLSACKAGPEVQKNEEFFLEDTLAHEEIFGDIDFAGFKPTIQKAVDPETNPDVGENISVGIQSKSEKENHISFRFVAAVTFTDENRAPTIAKWSRAVSKPDGSKAMSYSEIPCSAAYRSLSSAGDAYTIEQFNTAHGTSHTDFVVYTIRNIPTDEVHNSYYVAAYLSLTEGLSDTSKVVVTSVDESLQFAYYKDDGEYFLSGTINGEANKMIKASSKRSGDNKATFEYVDFAAGDTFVIKEFYGVDLYIKDSQIIDYWENSNIQRCFQDDSGKIKVRESMGGSYGLYFKNSEHLETEGWAPFNVPSGYFVRGTMNGWAASDPNYSLEHIRNNDGNYGILSNISLSADDEFKVWRASDDAWFGWRDGGVGSAKFTFGSDGNIKCTADGTYSVYFKDDCVWLG